MDTHVDDGCEEAAVALGQGDVAAGQLGVAPDTQQVHLVHAGAPCTHGGSVPYDLHWFVARYL